jgi:drug/metabolite transporter (DMT)-like permease
MFPVTAVAVTLAAAVLFGLSTVLEQHSTKEVPERGALQPRLLLDLAKRPMWLVALALQITGNALQVVALHIGELALVQPILVCDLLFAVLFAAAFAHRRPDRVLLAGAICCAAGVACFLAVARPSGGHRTVSGVSVLPVAVLLAVVLAACLAAARWGPKQVRSLWLALACGVDFGVTAFLLKLVPDTLSQGFGDPVRQWPLYVLVIVGPAGFLLNQNALQAGRLISPVLAIITTTDPLVSIALAHLWLGEKIASTPLDLAAEAISLAVMAIGIYALAHRAPHVMLPGAPGEHGNEVPTREDVSDGRRRARQGDRHRDQAQPSFRGRHRDAAGRHGPGAGDEALRRDRRRR